MKITNPFSHPKIVKRVTPIVTTVLLEYANAGQIWRMWHEHSALGQNITSWMAVSLALLLWINFYRVQKLRVAMVATIIGWLINMALIVTVAYFRLGGA